MDRSLDSPIRAGADAANPGVRRVGRDRKQVTANAQQLAADKGLIIRAVFHICPQCVLYIRCNDKYSIFRRAALCGSLLPVHSGAAGIVKEQQDGIFKCVFLIIKLQPVHLRDENAGSERASHNH